MNSDLYGKVFTVPKDVIDYLHQCHQAAGNVDETTEGFKRNKDLREKGEISYQQLKRMKNWFDNFNGLENDLPFILNGGHYVKNWVNDTLGGMRNNVYMGKKSKSEVLPSFEKIASITSCVSTSCCSLIFIFLFKGFSSDSPSLTRYSTSASLSFK